MPTTVLLCLALAASSPRVAFVGDSHMTVLGPMLERSFRDGGARPVGTIARVGWGTRRYQIADDLTAELRAMRPDVVVIALGSNDYGVRSTRRYEPRARWVVDAARRAGARWVVWVGPPAADATRGDVGATVAANHDAVAELQALVIPLLGATWIDARPVSVDHWRRDGYHLTRRGYRLLAEEVVALVLGCTC